MDAGSTFARRGSSGGGGLPECGRRSSPGAVSERACAFYGARWVLAAVRGAVHLVHGPVGCAYYGQTVRKRHYRVFSTALEEREIVLGAGGRLEAAIREAVRLEPGAGAVLVYVTCAAGLTGEDVAAICRQTAAALGLPVVPVTCPGFAGTSQADGQDLAARVLLEHLIGRGPAGPPLPKSVNLLGEFDVSGDLKEIERLLGRLGLATITAVSGRATVSGLAAAHRAALNLVHCGRTGRWLARQMQERFGIPWLKATFFGIEGTAASLAAVAAFFGQQDTTGWIEAEAEAARREALPYLRRLKGRRVVVFFGASRMGLMSLAFRELGMEVVLCGSQFGGREDYAESRSLLGEGTPLIDDPDGRELQEWWRRLRPDLVVGGSREKYLAHKTGLPFLVFPQETGPYAGFRGFVNLARETAGLVGARVWWLARTFRDGRMDAADGSGAPPARSRPRGGGDEANELPNLRGSCPRTSLLQPGCG
ncbi:MAG: nitrogenase component 1 [Clostridia bacterium]|jgi:nitrogenase molybdenum-cofactor synthesis protein NifE|nr:nitrogenase [Clostridia bacterium]MDH7573875.1 nitrogenase component 1 [Clostridia bacterium]